MYHHQSSHREYWDPCFCSIPGWHSNLSRSCRCVWLLPALSLSGACNAGSGDSSARGHEGGASHGGRAASQRQHTAQRSYTAQSRSTSARYVLLASLPLGANAAPALPASGEGAGKRGVTPPPAKNRAAIFACDPARVRGLVARAVLWQCRSPKCLHGPTCRVAQRHFACARCACTAAEARVREKKSGGSCCSATFCVQRAALLPPAMRADALTWRLAGDSRTRRSIRAGGSRGKSPSLPIRSVRTKSFGYKPFYVWLHARTPPCSRPKCTPKSALQQQACGRCCGAACARAAAAPCARMPLCGT